MRAARIHEHGDPTTFRIEEVEEPKVERDELLVRMRATSVNHRDVWIRRGHPHPAYRVDLPAILGIDVCGDVVRVGHDVENFSPGDRVTANPYIPCGRCPECRCERAQYCTAFDVFAGTYAEYVTVPERLAIKVGNHVPDEHVAAFPNAYVTAWQMLVGKARLTPDDVVFVWAGTSGLGNAAIDIATLSGARVITSAGSDAKVEVLQQRDKAEAVLHHHRDDIAAEVLELTSGNGATVVFEHIGTATWERSLEMLASGGRIVSAGATSGDAVSMDVTAMFVKQARILGSRLGTMQDAVAAARQLDLGRLSPLIGRVVPLDEIGRAHEELEQGSVIGKIIVTFP